MSRTEPSFGIMGLAAFRIEIPLLLTTFVSLLMIGYAAATGSKIVSAVGALLFVQRLIFTAWHATSSRHVLGPANDDRLPPLKVIQNTTRLSVWTYLWAACALLLAYPVLGLKWQHGWQYGAGAALLALSFAWYLFRLNTKNDKTAQPTAMETARRLSIVFAAAIAVAVAMLIGSGKLATPKSDWLANNVFLGTAAAILALSALCIVRARPNTR